jgi:death on curing protein
VEPVFLTLDDVLEMHQEQIERYGGSHGLRDPGALEPAVATPQASFGGFWLHPAIDARAAAYLFHLCQNHAFVDGNERVAANAAVVFLLMNDWEPLFEEDDLVTLVLGIAAGAIGKAQVVEWFHSLSRPIEGGKP